VDDDERRKGDRWGKGLPTKMTSTPDNKKTVLNYALEYHERGWCVIPIKPGSKEPAVRWKRYQAERSSERQLRTWLSNNNRNIAVVLGKVSGGLACRDFDTMQEYEIWVAKRPRLAKILPTVRTSKGVHVYFVGHVEGIHHTTNGELRGSGGYCLLPPSVHPDGQPYEWVNPLANSRLLTIRLELTGFIPNVTEQTEKTQQTEQTKAIVMGYSSEVEAKTKKKSKAKSEVENELETAIVETLPVQVGTRNRKIFEFARAIKSLPQFSDAEPEDLRDIVTVWHRRALPKIRTKEFEETWIDFLKAWPRIKYAKGEGPMAEIFERAIQFEPPPIAVEKYPNNSKLKILVSLCRELQKAAGEGAFFLSARTAGRLLNVSPMHASRWLFLLQSDGIIKLVCKGGTAETVRQASRYKYIVN
jgi:hypothetical protein